jgi:excisionase family DNA binding protein
MKVLGMQRRYMNVRQIANYIDSTPGSVRQLVRHKRIPHLRVAGGRRILFDMREIDGWLADHRVELKLAVPNRRETPDDPADEQRLREVEDELIKVHGEIHEYGCFDSAPGELAEKCERLSHERSLLKCSLGDDS